MNKTCLYTVLFWMLVSCGGGDNSAEESVEPIPYNPPVLTSENSPIPDNRYSDNYQILIIGNSHASPIKNLLNLIFQHEHPNVELYVEKRTADHLDSTLKNGMVNDLIHSRDWSHIILQGQKYSQNQSTLYPTTAAETWVQQAKSNNTMPILFPEHPQLERSFEAEYVHNIHLDIVKKQMSCIAPVGLAWNLALSLRPELDMHSTDGNHASALGTVLSAFVLYQVITGYSVDLLPFIEQLPADEGVQDFFGQIASQVIAENVPCNFSF